MKKQNVQSPASNTTLAIMWNDSLNALFQPKFETFIKQLNHATILDALIWVAIAGATTGLIQAIMSVYVYTSEFIGSVPADITVSLVIEFLTQFVIKTIMAGGVLVSISGIYHIIASLMGSKGDFEKQTYLMATYTAPLFLIAGIVYQLLSLSFVFSHIFYGYVFIQSFVLLFIATFTFMAYHIYLSRFVIRVIHKFDQRKSAKVIKWFTSIIIVIIFTYATLTVGIPLLFFGYSDIFFH
jgi:hypothetical protein